MKPTGLRRIVIERWGFRPSQVAYVGDLPYDMQSAAETELIPIGVAWGKKDADSSELRKLATMTFDNTGDFITWTRDLEE